MSTSFTKNGTTLDDYTQISSNISGTSNLYSDRVLNLVTGNITPDGSQLKGIHIAPVSGNVVIDGSLTVVGGGGTIAGVSQILPGNNTTISSTGPNGTGVVTVNSTGSGGGAVSQIIPGTNVSVSPSNGLGAVTVNAAAPPVTKLIAGNNVTLSPSNGLGDVTINATGGGGGGSGTVTQINVDSTLTGGPITTTGTLGVANTTVTAGIYYGDSSIFTIKGTGQITNVAGGTPTVYNVKSFGAVCNNSTDDTTAIQTAISACEAAGGGTIYFPGGISLITSTLTITSSCRFAGGNRSTCGIHQSSTSFNIFSITSGVYVSSYSMYYSGMSALSNNTIYIDDPIFAVVSGTTLTFSDPYSTAVNILINGVIQTNITSPYTINSGTFSLTSGNHYTLTINSGRIFELASIVLIYTA